VLSREQLLERQLAELTQRNQQLQQEMVLRAAPTFGELLDALDNLLAGAAQGDKACKAALEKFGRQLAAVRDLGSPITVIRS
jgi:ABC-type transporter Mla subunit MlaD